MSLDQSCLTIIVPIYNEESNLAELQSRIEKQCTLLNFQNYEVLLISDGSTDQSETIISRLVKKNSIFKGILLTRNFGHQQTISCGLKEATGSVICILDGDLQDPPEVIFDLVAALEKGADVAFGIRQKRKESILKRAIYSSFYRFLQRIASYDIPLDSGDFCCMRRRVVNAMLRLPEKNRFLRGIRAWVGYRQVGVPYERHKRFKGTPKLNVFKLIKLAYDGIFTSSSLPIKLMQFVGFCISSLALLIAFGYLFLYFVKPEKFPPGGWTTLVISIWFLGGIQMFFLGLIGEYVFRSFDESRNRPTYLIKQILVNSDLDEKP